MDAIAEDLRDYPSRYITGDKGKALKPPIPTTSAVQAKQMQISSSMYWKMLCLLRDEINDQDRFSGTIEFECDDIECSLTTSLLVYRKEISYPEGTFDEITNLIQTGRSKFHTYKDNKEVPNDFQFSELRSYI